MPDSIRLEFSLSFDQPRFPQSPAPTLDLFGPAVDVQVNETSYSISMIRRISLRAPVPFSTRSRITWVATVGTFMSTCPHNSAGESGPFRLLKLRDSSKAIAMSNWGAKTSQDATLSLDGVTFADGKILRLWKGYGLSFASGLELQTVPGADDVGRPLVPHRTWRGHGRLRQGHES